MATTNTLTVPEFQAQAAAGQFDADARLELIRGEICEMSPIGTRHAATVNWLMRFFSRRLGDEFILGVQNPVVLSDSTQLQPDLAIAAARADFYRTAHPGPPDLQLLIEVADSSLRLDREVKLPLYAAAGVEEVWIVDLIADRIEQYSQPGDGAYRQVRVAARGEDLTIRVLGGMRVEVAELLPPPAAGRQRRP